MRGRKLLPPVSSGAIYPVHPAVEWVWRRIKTNAVSQIEVSRRSGIATSTLRKWFRGECAPKLKDVSAVVAALGGKLEVHLEAVDD